MENIFTGLIPDPRIEEQKQKDYQHDEMYSALPIQWKEKTEFRQFPIRNQNGSGMCVAFSTAKVLGVNNSNENKEFATLSPRYIYVQRTDKNSSGMYLQKAGDIAIKSGSCLDTSMPSDNLPESQANNDTDKTAEVDSEAFKYRGKTYVFINNDANVMDNIATIIEKGYALVLTTRFHFSEWNDEPQIKVPTDQANNFHAITIVDYFIKNGEKCLLMEDSWGQQYGNNGRRILSETWIRSRMTGCMYIIDIESTQIEKPKYNFTQVMIYGQKSYHIIALQDVLKYEGFLPSNIDSTGFYGNLTAKAVLSWQRWHNIAPESELLALEGKRCGYKTLACLNQLYA